MNDYQIPAEPAAEVAVLGAILRAGELPPDVETMLLPEDFDDPHRGAVFAAILELARHGKPCDHVSVIAALDPAVRRALDNGATLIEYTSFAPVGQELAYHAQIVAKVAERRRYMNAGLRVVQLARSGEGDAELGDQIRQTIDAVPRAGHGEQRPAWDVLQAILEPKREVPGIRLGCRDLDEFINPLKPGTVSAIGARSGVGKTTLALDILRKAAIRQGKCSLFISIEMTAEEVYTKVLSAEAGVDYNKLLLGHTLTPAEDTRVAAAVARITAAPFHVADVDSCTLADHRALVREYKPDINALDFLGLATFAKADRHDLAISDYVYGIKRTSAQEDTHTVILSQFNRSSASRADKRPVMDDFRDSAALEHAAHLALMIHRPDLHDEEDRPGEVDVIIGKQRAGGHAGKAIPLAAQLHYSRFVDMTPEPTGYAGRDVTEPTRHQDSA